MNPNVTPPPVHSPVSATSAHRLCTEDRLIWLSEALDDAVKAFDRIDETLRNEGKTPLSRVMVAPEYFFAKPLPEGDSNDFYSESNADKQLTEQEKNDIMSRLKQMSARYPDVLLVPGTISFKKSIVRQETAEQYVARKGEGLSPEERTELETKFDYKDSRMNKAIDKHYRANDYGLYRQNTFLSRQTDMLSSSTTHIVKNTSYALLNGNIEHRHNKVAGYNEVTVHGEDERRAFIPGKADQGHLNFNGVSHSFEICGDHVNGVVSDSDEGPGKVHIIQSAFVHNILTPEIRSESDYMVHSSNLEHPSGHPRINGVIDTDRGGFMSPTETRLNVEEDQEASAVQVYVLGETL